MKFLKLVGPALISMLALITCAHAADRFDFKGTYTYSDVPELLQTIEVRVVKLYRDVDYSELGELKENGFHCLHVDSKTVRCARILTQAPLPQKVEDRIAKLFQGATIYFGAVSADAQVLYEGQNVIEYLITQPLRVMDEHYENYRYFINGDLHKLQSGEDIPSDHSFVADSSDRLSLIRTFSASTPNGFYRYLVALPFQK